MLSMLSQEQENERKTSNPRCPTWSCMPISDSESECAGDVYAEADAEDRCVGLLRREGGASVARQVGRYGGDSDADHQQPEAARRCGPAAGAGRAIAARHHRSSE